ncbi:hypothetical protein [Curtobacterium sp. UCD-KPL2560]|uniref:hypothetical protein n=1 Tax=Curtobacterium sp. UCD-KPL2560 TaxID=1885315 RepID=UPI000826097E|nr:hypothetical protein [Curtobacterium sp. UCD-KPL2560]
MQKTARLAATTGVALALGASLLTAAPATAATQHDAPSTVASAGVQSASEPTGPTFVDRHVSITTSIIQGDEVVVRGVVSKYQPEFVEAAAGAGYQTQAPVAADGSFEIRFPDVGGFPTRDYGLRFSKHLGSTLVRLSVLNTVAYAERV